MEQEFFVPIQPLIGVILLNEGYTCGVICSLSVPSEYLFNVGEENLGSTRKFVENYLLFTCITNHILALHPWSMGWRNLSKAEIKLE